MVIRRIEATYTYTYDYENRLTSASKTGMSATYTYDAFGRRIKKNVDGTITNYIYDGDQVISETDAAGTIQAKYIYGPGIDEPILMQRGGETYYYHFDGLGSVTAITDDTGAVVESYKYEIYGRATFYDANGQQINQSNIGNPYLFTARRLDEESSLYYFRSRYYSPSIGRFLQTDPIGYFDGLNPYTYVNNNPINWIDPFGLCKEKKDKWLKWGAENWLWQIIYGQNELIPAPGESWESYHERFVQDFGTQMAASDIIGLWGFKSLITTGGMYGATKGGEVLASRAAQRTLTTVGGRSFMYVRGLRQTMYLRQASSGLMAAGKVTGVITIGGTAYSGGLRLREWIYWKIATSIYNQ